MLISVEDARLAARRTLPRWLFDYVDGGAYSEASLKNNLASLSAVRFIPAILCGVSAPDTAVKILETHQTFPLVLAPVGMGGLLSVGGEVAVVRAAAAAGIQTCLSHFSIQSIEDIARAVDPAILMFQLYIFRDRAITRDTLQRVWNAGVRTLVVTVDTPVTPMRERDARNGFRSISKLSFRHFTQMMIRPGWTWNMAHKGGRLMANLEPYGMGKTFFAQSATISRELDPTINWLDLKWIREVWKGRLVIKGVLHPEDTRRSAELGAEGIVLSNHGGRQLDGAVSGFEMLSKNVQAANGRLDILVDGGFRYGSDIAKAMALGASGVMIGRPWAFGLAAEGQKGVADVIDYFHQGLRSTMTLLGARDIAALREGGKDFLRGVSGAACEPVPSSSIMKEHV